MTADQKIEICTHSSLTPKQEAFCREFIKDWNATAAYKRAGYSEKGANALASRLIAKDSISQRISALKEEKISREQELIDLAFLAQKDILRFDPADLQDENGNWIDLKKIPKHIRHVLLASKHSTKILDDGNSAFAETSYKYPDKGKISTEVLKGFGIFKDQMADALNKTVDFAERLIAAKNRAQARNKALSE